MQNVESLQANNKTFIVGRRWNIHPSAG